MDKEEKSYRRVVNGLAKCIRLRARLGQEGRDTK